MNRTTCSILLVAAATIVALACFPALAYNNGLARKPIRGWSTWCTDDGICGLLFEKCSEQGVLEQAQALIDSGMAKAGYSYIQLDDCWAAKQRVNGHLVPDANRFPKGMKHLADTLHSMKLLLGLYLCVGTKTCKHGLPGSFGFYENDANTMSEWGVDYVKMDNCAKPSNYTDRELYGNFSYYLNATGREIYFGLCSWGTEDVVSWGGTLAQGYRIQMDHLPLWDAPFGRAAGAGYGQGSLQIIQYVGYLSRTLDFWSGPYSWGDPDFLMTLYAIGGKLPIMTYVQSRTEFSFWCLWSSPLLVATTLVNMTAEKKSILLNKEVLAIDQDDLGIPGKLVHFVASTGAMIWTKPLASGDAAVIFFNSALWGGNLSIGVQSWSEIGLEGTRFRALDLWKDQKNPQWFNATSGFVANLKPDDCTMLRVTCMPGPCLKPSAARHVRK